MNSSVLFQYEEAMKQKRQAEIVIAALKESAMQEVRALGSAEKNGIRVRYAGNTGSFMLTKYISYTYSPAIAKAEQALKNMKAREVLDNIATPTEKEMFMFKQK